MTLILALRCQDAVVMAADSQATESQGGNPAAGVRHDVEKIWQLGPNVLWGGSGSGGVIQDVKAALDEWAATNAPRFAGQPRRLKGDLVGVVRPIVKAAYDGYVHIPGRPPSPPVTSFLFAGRTDDFRWILEIDENGGGELKTGDFAAIGSAYHFANVAAAMVSKYSASTHGYVHGQLLALRILDTAVTATAFGVGGALRLALVGPDGTKVLDNAEVDQLRDQVDAWREAEAATLEELVLRKPDAAMVPESATIAAPEPTTGSTSQGAADS